jgi:hypothetical protein
MVYIIMEVSVTRNVIFNARKGTNSKLAIRILARQEADVIVMAREDTDLFN